MTHQDSPNSPIAVDSGRTHLLAGSSRAVNRLLIQRMISPTENRSEVHGTVRSDTFTYQAEYRSGRSNNRGEGDESLRHGCAGLVIFHAGETSGNRRRRSVYSIRAD